MFVLCLIILMSGTFCVVDASAGIAIPGDCTVYPLSEKEISVPLQNVGLSPVLAQIWIEMEVTIKNRVIKNTIFDYYVNFPH